MRRIIKLSIITAVVALVPVIGLTASTAAYAGTGTGCNGTSCSGLDPAHSYNSSNGDECSTAAYTVLSRNVLGGYLELRWGPDCQTNWTRFTPGNNDEYEIWVTNIDTGVWAGTGLYNPYIFSHGAGVTFYSDQVYTGPQNASACVRDITTNSNDACVTQ